MATDFVASSGSFASFEGDTGEAVNSLPSDDEGSHKLPINLFISDPYRWRAIRFFVLAVLLLSGGVAAWHLTTELEGRADGMSRYNRVDTWTVHEVEFELLNLRNAFARHVAGDPQANVAALRKQIAVARSTIPLMRRSEDYEQFRLYVDLDATADHVLMALDRIDALLSDFGPFKGEPRILEEFVDPILQEPTEALRRLAIDVSHARLALQDGDLNNVRWLIGVNKWMLAAFIVCAGLFIGMLLFEVMAARKAQRVAQENEWQTRYVAEHDPLTGLANRSVFASQFTAILNRAKADDRQVALFTLDLDGFKHVNDTFGHHFGDQLLLAVSDRLRALLKGDDFLARLGGDEFALVQPVPDVIGGWQETARSLLASFDAPFHFQGRQIAIGTSIGIALFPEHGGTAEALLKASDLALYAAKDAGKCRFAVFDVAMTKTAERHQTLEEALRETIALGGLEIVLQPQVSLPDRRCIGAEALVRWTHPILGVVSPGEFIPVAEDSGLILPLGRWVMEEACRQAMLWDGDIANAVVAVNVSPAQFMFEDMVEETRKVLTMTGLPPWRLELEITEGLLMRDKQAAVDTLHRLDALGCHLAIDDFGTGYSSLAYLKHFRIHKMKIDRAFVQDCDVDIKDRMIGNAIASLAHGLGMKTIAEGVETEAQAQLVASMGVGEGQGYLYGKPMKTSEFRRRFRHSSNSHGCTHNAA